MTYGEAINIIYRSVIIDVATREQTSEALMLMTKAVEKQIPKKPLNKTMEYNGDYGECPCCGRTVSDYDDIKRCPDCGQALDWSGRERKGNE